MAGQSLRDRVRARAEEKAHSGGNHITLPEGVKFFEIKKGMNILDVVPYEVKATNHPEAKAGELWYKRPYALHRDIGAEKKRVICPLKTIKKPCPICEHRAGLMKDYDANEAMIKDLKPSDRELFNVDCGKAGIQVVDQSYFCFGEKLDKEVREGREELAGFADLQEGLTLNARFAEVALGKNTFLENDRIDFVERDPFPESVLDEVVDLDSTLNIMSYDEIEALFLELDSPDSSSAPARGQRTGRGDAPAAARPGREERRPAAEPAREERRPAAEPAAERPRRGAPPVEAAAEPPAERPRRGAPAAEPAAATPATTTRQRQPVEEAKPAADPNVPVCPAGGSWGQDCDTIKDKDGVPGCYTCKIWDGCRDEKDAIEAAAGSRRR